MKYNFDSIIDRTETNSNKWEFMQALAPNAGPDTLPFWVADMDFPCAAPVIEAIHQRTDRLIFGYSNFHTPRFFRAVCGWYQHRFHWHIHSADIFYSPGVVPAIGFLIQALTKPNEGILIQPPVYFPFSNMIQNYGRQVVTNPLLNQNGYYTMDYADLDKKAADPATRLLILCSPHNPVGRVWKREELEKLVAICKKNHVSIISDEIHCDIIRQTFRHYPLETVAPDYKTHIFTCTAPSKTFNLAGLQLSNIIIHDSNVKDSWASYVSSKLGIHNPTPLSISAVQAAYEEGEDWLQQVNAYIDQNIDFVEKFIADAMPKARFFKAEGTYLIWIDVKGYGYTNEQVTQMLIDEADVLIEDGKMFGKEGDGYIRLNVACPRILLEEGLRRIARTLEHPGSDSAARKSRA